MTNPDTTPALIAAATTSSVTTHRTIPMSRIITTELWDSGGPGHPGADRGSRLGHLPPTV